MVSKSGNQKGGGFGSRQHVETSVRTGSGSRGTNPGGVGQLGNIQGSHVTRGEDSNYRGDPLHSGRSFQPVKFGNEVALNVGKGGCGTGRTVYASGSQGTQGSTSPGNPRPTPSRHIIESYGPDYRRPGNPRSRYRRGLLNTGKENEHG
jgi:hypothetical protein